MEKYREMVDSIDAVFLKIWAKFFISIAYRKQGEDSEINNERLQELILFCEEKKLVSLVKEMEKYKRLLFAQDVSDNLGEIFNLVVCRNANQCFHRNQISCR